MAPGSAPKRGTARPAVHKSVASFWFRSRVPQPATGTVVNEAGETLGKMRRDLLGSITFWLWGGPVRARCPGRGAALRAAPRPGNDRAPLGPLGLPMVAMYRRHRSFPRKR